MAQSIRVRDAFERNLAQTGTVYRDEQPVTSIEPHPAGRGFYIVVLAETATARGDTLSLFGSSLLEHEMTEK